MDRHLSPPEILAAADHRPQDAAVQQHLAGCAACQAELAQWSSSRNLLSGLFAGGDPETAAVPNPDCPGYEALLRVIRSPDAAADEAILAHAATCGACGPALRDALLAQELKTASPQWRKSFARTLAPALRERRYSMAWMAVAAGFVAAALGLSWWRYTVATAPEALLARAYTASRPFEYRLPDSGYSSPDSRRGSEASTFDRRPELSRAEAEIQRRLAAQPEDASALALKGMAELQEREYEPAIDSLTHAADIAPPDDRAMVALACAYMLRGDAERRNLDYGHALDLLLKARKKNPANRPALFNLAIAYEKLSLLDEAAETWQKLLALPPDAWSSEARGRLQAIETIRKRRQHAESAITGNPLVFLQLPRSSWEPEAYFDVFWTNWLRLVAVDPAARQAGTILGAEAFRRYGDRSIADAVLAAPSTNVPATALAAVGEVILANRSGNSDRALALIQTALPALESRHQTAAALRLSGELAYIYRVQSRFPECLAVSEAALARIRSRPYAWMAAQNHLEHAICVNYLLGRSELARSETAAAVQGLADRGLQLYSLRALGLLTDVDLTAGNYAPLWSNAPAGLNSYWKSAASPFRAQQFEGSLEESAAAIGWDDASAAIYGAQVRSAAHAGDRRMEAGDRVEYAIRLRATGDASGEIRELDAADRLFHELPAGPAIAVQLWASRLTRAEASISSGRAASVLPELDALSRQLAATDLDSRVRLEQVRGRASLAVADGRAAAASFERAIRANQPRVDSFRSPLDRLAAAEATKEAYRGLTQIELSENDAVAAFATWQRSRAAFSPPGAPILLSASSQPDLLIAFAVLPRGVAVFSQSRSGVRFRFVNAAAADLERVSRRFDRLCSSPAGSPSEIRQVGLQLFAWLLAPELRDLPRGTPVLLQTDGWLASIPFGALPIDSTAYVVNRWPVVQLAAALPLARPPEELDRNTEALLVAVPRAHAPGGPRLPTLSAASQETEDLGSAFLHASLLTGDAATPESILLTMPRARVFHFAGHGWSDGGNGALLLAPGPGGDSRYLAAHEIAAQDWSRYSLAVLSACLTGVGERKGAVNNQSLVRAFLAAGAHQVVASRWSVNSEATRFLMEAFYRRLLAGAGAPEAMRQAALTVAQQKAWSHPFYWAGFDVYRN